MDKYQKEELKYSVEMLETIAEDLENGISKQECANRIKEEADLLRSEFDIKNS